MKITRIAPLGALLFAAACGGSGGSDPTYAVKGTVSGLAPGVGVTLQLSGQAGTLQNVTVDADGAFTFTSRLAEAATWTVVALPSSQVPRQTCQVTPGTGTIAAADATVAVTCATLTYAVGGTVTGLPAGEVVTLRGPGGDLPVTSAGDPTTFAFTTRVASGGAFQVTVPAQPAGRTCLVSGGGPGTVAAADVVVTVACEANDKPVAGTISGLAGATGVVLQVNDAYDTPVAANGAFSVLTGVRAGTTWTLTVKTQPTQPWQTCTATLGPPPSTLPASGLMGAAGASGVVVSCATDTFAVGGTAAGLLLPGLTLRLDGGAPLAVGGDSTFTFPVKVVSGQAWLVTVEGLPATQACAVTGGSGTMEGADVTGVVVTCGCAAGLGNCNAGPGCETTVLGSDAANCGACGNACAFPNAGAHCAAGTCVMDACTGTFGDCGAGAGCETDLSTSPANCGACGRACSVPNAAPACVAMNCTVGTCNPGFGDCTGAPGCETNVLSSAANCGFCGNACSFPNAAASCANGNCAMASCNPGFGDCDGQAVTGCEAEFASDPFNCGRCLKACSFANAAGSCAAGNCSMGTCDVGFGNCNNDPVDGCEVNTRTDPLHCGDCLTTCTALPHAQPSCGSGACNTARCDAGWGDCNGQVPDGCEQPLSADPNHCGSCGAFCLADQVCSASHCVAQPSCLAIHLASLSAPSGLYTIDPDGAGAGAPMEVWCDMTTDGGGWTFFAHVGEDSAVGDFFVTDQGTYLADRTVQVDPVTSASASYGLGHTVYQPLLAQGASELLVTAYNADPGAVAAVLAYYQISRTSNAFTAGPLPCTATDLSLKYRTTLGSYFDGTFAICDDSTWMPYTGTGDMFIDDMIIGLGANAGTWIGHAADPLVLHGAEQAGKPSWWYVR